jgi:hypothetical protein
VRALVRTLLFVFKSRTNQLLFVGITVAFLILFLFLQNFSGVFSLLRFSQISLIERLRIGVLSFFDVSSAVTIETSILIYCTALLVGINTTLTYVYFTRYGKYLMKNGLQSGVSALAVFIGVGCSACGGVMLTFLVSVFGVTYVYTEYLTAFGYVGVGVLFAGTCSLLKSLQPTVCS